MHTNQNTPEVVTGTKLTADITDKRGYADHWGFSLRKIDQLLAKGLPHCKISARMVRICIAEADAWMNAQFRTQRIGRANQ